MRRQAHDRLAALYIAFALLALHLAAKAGDSPMIAQKCEACGGPVHRPTWGCTRPNKGAVESNAPAAWPGTDAHRYAHCGSCGVTIRNFNGNSVWRDRGGHITCDQEPAAPGAAFHAPRVIPREQDH